MQILDEITLLPIIAKALNKPCMFISFSTEYEWDEIVKAAPYLNIRRDMDILANGQAFLIFDSEQEMNETYSKTVGEDGHTKQNPYPGPAKVYAITCHTKGTLGTENT